MSNARFPDLRATRQPCWRLSFLQLRLDGRRRTLSNQHLVLWLLVCGLLSPPKGKLLEGRAVSPYPSRSPHKQQTLTNV